MQPDCFDHVCWADQGDPTETFEEGWSGYWDFRIVASHLDRMWVGTFPFSFNVYICGTYDCLQHYDVWTWSTQPPWHAEGAFPLYESACQVIPPCSSGCSYITVTPVGTGFNCPNCGTDVCFYNQTGVSVGTFTLNFNPPLDPTGTCDPSSPVPCASNSTPPTSFKSSLGNWHLTGYNPITGDVTFSYFSGAELANCSSICVYVPRCDIDPGTQETITLVNPVNPGTCDPNNITIIADMKKVDGTLSTPPGDSGGQNFPNPLDAASEFNTTIPFATSTPGMAIITIANERGIKVLTDDEEILGAGQHFFYFSAKDIPSGTYYYTIEFPQGVIIASKTILVVK